VSSCHECQTVESGSFDVGQRSLGDLRCYLDSSNKGLILSVESTEDSTNFPLFSICCPVIRALLSPIDCHRGADLLSASNRDLLWIHSILYHSLPASICSPAFTVGFPSLHRPRASEHCRSLELLHISPLFGDRDICIFIEVASNRCQPLWNVLCSGSDHNRIPPQMH
jgi:hypothetical protein